MLQADEVSVMTTVGSRRQAPPKVDPATDELISRAAHFLGMSKKDFVAEAVRTYLDQRREEIRRGMAASTEYQCAWARGGPDHSDGSAKATSVTSLFSRTAEWP